MVANSINMALGTAQWGLRYGIANRTGVPSDGQLRAMISRAKEAGVTTLDTARAYGFSEQAIGQIVGDDPAFEVVTKLSPDITCASGSAKAACQAARESLRCSHSALGRERLDVLLLHRAEQRLAHGGAIWELLLSEKKSGRIGRLGISAACPDEALAALQDSGVEAIQVAASLLDQRLVRRGFFQLAHERKCHIFVRSVFLQGAALLPIAEIPSGLDDLRRPLEAVDRWCSQNGVQRSAALMAFIRSIPNVTAVFGCETPEQLQSNLAGWRRAETIADQIKSLADSIPALPDRVLDPSQWPAVETPASRTKIPA